MASSLTIRRGAFYLAMSLVCAAPGFAKPPPGGDPAALSRACTASDGGSGSYLMPAPPARIYGNTYFVGTCGITALLVASDKGHVLIDGGPAEAAPLVAASIAKLGFKTSDVRWIVSSHEHWDHVGALAGLQRLTGAKIAAVPVAAEALTTGRSRADDPQRTIARDFAPVAVDRVVRDGEAIVVGSLRLTAHVTPAHAPGSASWTWQSCAGRSCRTIAYADSATIISADDYRFADHPERVVAARNGLAAIVALPCDLLITPHPGASDLFERLGGSAALIDAQACRRYAERAQARFAQRLADEAGETAR